MPSPEQSQAFAGRRLRAVAAWAQRGRQRRRFRRVEADHPEQFRLGIARQLLVAAAIVLPFLAICWLAWEVGAK